MSRTLKILLPREAFNEIASAARSCGQPITKFAREILECDAASRRLQSFSSDGADHEKPDPLTGRAFRAERTVS
jgi:hypothetical protein